MDSIQSSSAEDIFDSSLNIEETHLKEGFNAGYEDGLESGREDARYLGLQMGFETGELLGFYRGCVDVWNSLMQIEPTNFSNHVQKHIKEFEELIEKYPLMDPEDENIDKIKEGLRVKFNVICASMGLVRKKLEYKGYPKVSNDLEF